MQGTHYPRHLDLFAGLGFKAVAMIAQATYIDSGGFNFVFDTRPQSWPEDPEMRWLGLVCPSWVEDLSLKMEEWIVDSTAGMAGKPLGLVG